jgi:signal transduction histidine kinase
MTVVPGLPNTSAQAPGVNAPTMAGAAIGAAAGQPPGDAATYHVADRITVALLAALRAGTLLLGGIELLGGARWRSPATAGWLLAGLTCLSAVTFARAGRRVAERQNARRPFDAATVVTETLAGGAALLILAYATPPGARASSGFWAEPYTVISAVIIAAAARRAWSGALAVACLTGAYLISVLPGISGPPAAVQAYITAAWTNATSYPAFYVLAAMGLRLLYSTAGQAETLRQEIARLSADRSRVVVAGRIYRIGHDIPKALLREVRRATQPSERLRALAPRYKADLLRKLAADPRAPVDLHEELGRVAATYAAGMQLEVDLAAMSSQPPGVPALLMAEAVRELLNNASYHRYGYPARLTGSATAERVEVSVHNDGPGVEPRRLASAWALKQNTIHQFEAAGGSYQIHSEPPAAGTTVVLRYPGDTDRGTTAP